MPVASVNGLKKAASSAAVQLPPQVLTNIVRVWAIVRSVTINGPAAAAVAVAANPLRNVRRRMVVLRGGIIPLTVLGCQGADRRAVLHRFSVSRFAASRTAVLTRRADPRPASAAPRAPSPRGAS